MILGGIENGNENANDAFSFHAFGEWVAMGVGEERAGKITDGGYYDGEMVAAVPEAIVGGLITEDLGIPSTSEKGI